MKSSLMSLSLLLLLCLVPAQVPAGQEIIVSAAISLKNAFTDLGKIFEKSRPDVKVNFNFGASGDLMRQIQGGAPAAVFASASQKDMDSLEEAGRLVPGSRADFAGNAVVLVQPKLAAVKLTSFADLAKPEVKKIAIGNPRTVPAGRYAMEVLTHFKLADFLKDKLVLAENVRQVLDYVARGEVDAGVVYQTDAMTRPQEVQVVAAAPPGSHKPAVYPLSLVKGGTNEPLAQEFVALVHSPQGQEVLQKYGFKPVPQK